MGGTFSRELNLAKRLQDLCDDQGKEINPTKSADILHEFGLLYQEKSPDKISLIQSATFLNAAVVRQPSNQVFEKSLKYLCSHVLVAAKAEQPRADLIRISQKVAKKIDEMRKHTKNSLEKVEIIPSKLQPDDLDMLETNLTKQIRDLQAEISEKYTYIMDFVAQKCVKLMGKPPCRYSVTGMGSLARKEITPYSDFEHAIILEEGVQHRENYDDILEYFRWFSVIFHVIIINLKETIIRAVAVEWLNDDSIDGGDWFYDAQINPGIKFDGMQLPACKFPLGRPWKTDNKSSTVELIKPVSEMVKFLSLDEDVKNGYHLADVLTKTCFVSGYEEIHQQYQLQVTKILTDQNAALKQLIIANIKYEMEHDWKDFEPLSVGYDFSQAFKCNIKSSLYRSLTLLLSALGRIHSIHEYSCFDIVDILFERQTIDDDDKHNLQYALSVSCLARLKVYMAKGGQDDFIGGGDFGRTDFRTINEVVDLIGEESLIDYLSTARSLWLSVHENTIVSYSFDSVFAVLYMLQFHERVIQEWENYSSSEDRKPTKDELDMMIFTAMSYLLNENYDKALELFAILEAEPLGPLMCAGILLSKCKSEISSLPSTAANECIKQAKTKTKCLELTPEERNLSLGHLCRVDGDNKLEQDEYIEAITSFKEALNYYNQCTELTGPKENMIECHHGIAASLIKLNDETEAIKHFEAMLGVIKDSPHLFRGNDMYNAYMGLTVCYGRLNQLDKALEYKHKCLDLKRQYQLN